MWRTVAAFVLLAGPAFAGSADTTVTVNPLNGPPNTLVLTGASGAAAANYPFQFGRPFIEGAIPHSPQVLVNGSPVPSQADVKNRYPDGSVEFAVMAAVIPQISPSDCSISNTNPTEMPPYVLSAIHGNLPVFNVPANPTKDPLQNVLYNPNCHHFDGGVARTMISTENTTVASNVGGQAGFTEEPPYPAPTTPGVMFSAMVCNGQTWCPKLSVGCDEEKGCLWSPITPTPNGDAVEVVTTSGADGPVNIYFNGTRVAPDPSLFPLPSTTPSEPFNTDGTLTWGADGDHDPQYETGVIISDQIFTPGAMPAATVASLSAAMNAYYATPGSVSPQECSMPGVTCSIALSVTHRMVAGATTPITLYNVSAATSQAIGFDANGNTNTAQALAFCGTVANCRLEKVSDQTAENASPSSNVLTFADSTAASTPLTLAQMEAMLPVGAAAMTLTPGGTADAGQMLLDGNCTPWTQGSVAQTMMCGDDTNTRKYDMGFGDSYHPFRPRFYVTFWPTTGQVYVRAVGECGLTTEQEDCAYNLALASNGTTVYSKDLSGDVSLGTSTKYKLVHWVNTRWTHTFWLGGTPPASVNIDQNLAYLDSTRFLPNLDTSVVIPPVTITAYHTLFQTSPNDIYDGDWDGSGPLAWTSSMGTAGGSNHIGPFPSTTMLWLHSADWRLRQLGLTRTDEAAAWPMDYRESQTGRIFQRGDTAGSNTGLGRNLSAAARPEWNVSGILVDDAITVGPTATSHPWAADDAHQPSVFFPAYVLTGDPWYLDMLYAWIGWTVFETAPSPDYDCVKQTTNCSAYRGPTGAYGGLSGTAARALAWSLRGRAEAAFIAPDGTPEKSYFHYMTNDIIAKWEGGLGITGTAFDTSTEKQWVLSTDHPYFPTMAMGGSIIPPLGNVAAFCIGTCYSATQLQAWGIVPAQAGALEDLWMNFYMEYALGRAVDLGFPMKQIQAHYEQLPIGIIASPYPEMLNAYTVSMSSPSLAYYTDWTTMVTTGEDPTYEANLKSGFTASLGDYVYASLVAGGLASAVDNAVPGASAAWAWYKPNVYDILSSNGTNALDPKWAIVPRTDNNVLPPQSTVTPP